MKERASDDSIGHLIDAIREHAMTWSAIQCSKRGVFHLCSESGYINCDTSRKGNESTRTRAANIVPDKRCRARGCVNNWPDYSPIHK